MSRGSNVLTVAQPARSAGIALLAEDAGHRARVHPWWHCFLGLTSTMILGVSRVVTSASCGIQGLRMECWFDFYDVDIVLLKVLMNIESVNVSICLFSSGVSIRSVAPNSKECW
jgi:hypothetical protein